MQILRHGLADRSSDICRVADDVFFVSVHDIVSRNFRRELYGCGQMIRILKADYLESQQILHKIGKEYRPVCTISISIMQIFLRKK